MDDSLLVELQSQGITHPKVLAALQKIPREQFIKKIFRKHAYENIPLPIGYHQTISQPYIVGSMTQALLEDPLPHRVLEIGTGSGYQAAILASIFDEVWTIERIPKLYERAQKILEELHFRNIHFKLGDGTKGWPEFAPFDAIIVTAATQTPPYALIEELSPVYGKLLIPLGKENEVQKLTLFTRHGRDYTDQYLESVLFVPLIANG